MGLDMYLYLEKYESVAPWREDAVERAKSFYPAELKQFGNDIYKREFLVKETKCLVGYWRKAYAINEWIENHCTMGESASHDVYISEDDAAKLMGICKEIYSDHSKATELLHISDRDELDEYFYSDILYTAELLAKVLGFMATEEGENYDLIYNASW